MLSETSAGSSVSAAAFVVAELVAVPVAWDVAGVLCDDVGVVWLADEPDPVPDDEDAPLPLDEPVVPVTGRLPMGSSIGTVQR